MKINTEHMINGLDGKPISHKEKSLDLKTVCIEALMCLAASDERASGEEKFHRYQIAQKINKGGEVELTPEEVVIIKKRVGEVYGAVVLGPVYELLNG